MLASWIVLCGLCFAPVATAQADAGNSSITPNATATCGELSLQEAARTGAWVGGAIGAGFLAAFLLAACLFTCPCSGPALDWTCTIVGCECCPASCCKDAGDNHDDADNSSRSSSDNQADTLAARGTTISLDSSRRMTQLGLGPRRSSKGSKHAARAAGPGDSRTLSASLLHAEYVGSQVADEAGGGGDEDGFEGPGGDSVVLVEPPGVEGDDRQAGEFGAFLTLVEFLDAIPESMVLAEAVARGKVQLALIISIVILNFSTGFAMFVDLIRSPTSDIHGDQRVYQLLFVSATLAAGMLVFAVSDEVYANFTEHKGDDRLLSLGLLIGGTVLGASLVLALMWLSTAQAASQLKRKLWAFLDCCSIPSLKSGSSWISMVRKGRVIKSLLLVLSLTLWLIVLTIVGVLIFRRETVEKDFIEGFSGGAFIITIGGTLLPEAHHAAHKTQWSTTQRQIVGASSFLLGLILAVVLKLLEGDDANDPCA